MDKAIEVANRLLEGLEGEYEEALQQEGETQVAFREGCIAGIRALIVELESFKEV